MGRVLRVFTKSGLQIAHNFERIVHGGRGDYIEISEKDIIQSSIEMPEDSAWRLFFDKAYYLEFRSKDIDNVMIYFQRMLVKYADYRLGYYYIDPDEVVLKE